MHRWLVIALIVTIFGTSFAVFADPVSTAGTFRGDRAMNDIATQLSFGTRAMDSAGHESEIQFIESEMAKTKAATVKGQQWIETGSDGVRNYNFLGWARTTNGSKQ